MRYRCLLLCSAVLSCQLMAEEKPIENSTLELGDISAARRSYEATFDPIARTVTVIPSKDSREISNNLITLLGGSVVLTNQSNNSASGGVTFGASGSTVVCSSGFSTFFKADSSYAKSMPIRHFILSELQMAQFFSNFPPRPEPLNFYGLSESKLYLIVQIKNIGARNASGILYFPFFRKFFSVSINVEPEMSDFSTYVVPLSARDREDFEDIDEVNKILDGLVWDELHTGPTIEEFLEQPEEYLGKDEKNHVSAIDDNVEEDTGFFPIFRSPE